MRATIVLLLPLLLALSARPAAGDEPSPSGDTAKARASVLLNAGLDLQDAGDHLGALDLFRQAYAAYPSPYLHLNLGSALWNLGRFTEAAAEFERLLADADAREEKKAEARRFLAELAKQIATLTIRVRPTTATLTVDGVAVNVAADGTARVRVDPGTRSIVAQASGFLPTTELVQPAPGEQRTVEIALSAIQLPDAPEPTVIERIVTAPPALRSTGQRLGAIAGVVLDPQGPGAVGIVGGRYGLASWIDVEIAALLGVRRAVQPALSAHPFGSRVRPTITVAAPTFYVDGWRPGLRGAVGVEWRALDWLSLAVNVGVDHYASVPDDHVKTVFAPAFVARARQ